MGSKDLKNWEKLSDFGPAGYTKNGWECPSLMPLPVDGNPAKIKYVLFVSNFADHGPQMQYFVGDFDGTTFTNLNPADQMLRVDYGDSFYAAISWRNAPGNKKIFLGWLINGKPETYPWKGQMSIPRDLSLRSTTEGIRLFQNPASVITNSLPKFANGPALTKKDLHVNGMVKLSSASQFNKNAYWIDAELRPGKSGKSGFIVAATKDGAKKVEVGYDAENHQIYVDCTSSESANKDQRNLVQTAPMKPVNGIVRLRVLVDKSSLEVFGNNGEQVISTMIYPDSDANNLSAFATGNAIINNLKIWDMNK